MDRVNQFRLKDAFRWNILIAESLAILLFVQSPSSSAQDVIDKSEGVFCVKVDKNGHATYGGKESPFLTLPKEASTKPLNMAALLDAWKKYYLGYLNGDQEILKSYSVSGVVPTIPSRVAGEKAEISILSISQRGGSVRVLVHWIVYHSDNNKIQFYDCHVWSQGEGGEWRVKSIMQED